MRTINSKDFLIWVQKNSEWILWGCATDINLDFSSEATEASCKATGAWGDSTQGIKTWSADVTALHRIAEAGDTEENYTTVDTYDDFNSGATIKVKMGTSTVGDPIWTGDVFVSSLSIASSGSENVSVSTTLVGKNEPVRSTVTA